MTAVSQNGLALIDASEGMKGNREVVMTAVSQNGRALQYATEELKGDRAVVMAAVSQVGLSLRFATAELRGDEVFTQVALAHPNGEALLALRVSLLSGRSCNQIFSNRRGGKGIDDVLRECADMSGS